MIRADQVRAARKRYREMAPLLNEQRRRRFLAMQLGRGGVSLLARISGVARLTIYRSLSDLHDKASAPLRRIRKNGDWNYTISPAPESLQEDELTDLFMDRPLRRKWKLG